MTFSIIVFAFCELVGLYLIVIGSLIWLKGKIKFINKNNYARVKEQDKPAYCKGVGQGNAVAGLGTMLLGGSSYYLDSTIGLIASLVIIGLGFYIIIKTQIKYNGSLV